MADTATAPGLGLNIPPELRQKILDRYMATGEGRVKIARSLTQPLRFRRDYTSQGRKALLVDTLPDGALPIYDKDPEATAFVVGEEGQSILAIQKPDRVIFTLFEIASNPEFPLTQIRERRYDLVKRGQDLAIAEIQAAEDIRVFATFDAVQAVGFGGFPPNPDKVVTAPLTPDILADAWADIETHDVRVARMFMNAKDYTDLRKFGRDTLDFQTQAVLLHTGLLATLWGVQILVTRVVPRGIVYVCGDKEFLGRIPERTPLTVLSADDPKRRRVGFSIFEQIGIGVNNPLALSRILISR